MDDTVKTGGRALVRVEEHEGSLLYSDVNGRDGVRALSTLSVVIFLDPKTNNTQVGWHTVGSLALSIEALATYYVSFPGFKDAVDGMYEFLSKQRRMGVPESEKK